MDWRVYSWCWIIMTIYLMLIILLYIQGSTYIRPLRLAFAGGSLLYELALWWNGKTSKYRPNFPYIITRNTDTVRYFKVCSYYPIKTFTSNSVNKCCGETDCLKRQNDRKSRVWSSVLHDSLKWLEEYHMQETTLIHS